jgi:hypothetical protein
VSVGLKVSGTALQDEGEMVFGSWHFFHAPTPTGSLAHREEFMARVGVREPRFDLSIQSVNSPDPLVTASGRLGDFLSEPSDDRYDEIPE